eukprot:scaffold2140_cov394-Prasinococcus_capsulatus_cf.AAC.25
MSQTRHACKLRPIASRFMHNAAWRHIRCLRIPSLPATSAFSHTQLRPSGQQQAVVMAATVLTFAASSVNDVGTCAAIDIVRPLPAIHEVLTVLAEQRIELRATCVPRRWKDETIRGGFSMLFARSALQLSSPPTKDGVLAASSINHVQPADGVEDVIATCTSPPRAVVARTAAVDDVVSTGAHDAVAPVGAGGLPHVLVHEDEVAVVGTQLFELFLVCGDAHVRSRTCTEPHEDAHR